MRRPVGQVLSVAVLLEAAAAQADPPSLAPDAAHTSRLSFVREAGTESCPGEAALRSAVTARLGYDPFRSDAPKSVTASVRRSTRGLTGEVVLRGAQGAVEGVRRLSAGEDECSELVATMALAISIAIDPKIAFDPLPSPATPAGAEGSGATSSTLPSPPGPGPPPPPPAPEPWLVAPPVPAPLPSPAWESPPQPVPEKGPSGWIGAGALVAGGAAPGVSGGAVLEGGVRVGWFSAGLEGRIDPPSSATATGGGTVSAMLVTVGVVPCFHVRVVALCAVGAAGVVHGAGAGVAPAKTQTTGFGAAGPRTGVELPFAGRFSAELHADLAFPLVRTSLDLNEHTVWTAPVAAGAVGAGLRVHFP